ncbi:MAG TPA: hypothetical protein VNC78_09485 [Actinomycetota bacterium]|nr:hypothetical protein [Actinomycetota bacterium]
MKGLRKVQVGEEWWAQDPAGNWLQWDHHKGHWAISPIAPTMPDTAAPPPPPLPGPRAPTASGIVASQRGDHAGPFRVFLDHLIDGDFLFARAVAWTVFAANIASARLFDWTEDPVFEARLVAVMSILLIGMIDFLDWSSGDMLYRYFASAGWGGKLKFLAVVFVGLFAASLKIAL